MRGAEFVSRRSNRMPEIALVSLNRHSTADSRAREVEEIDDQVMHALACSHDATRHVAHFFRIESFLEHQPRGRDDGKDGVAKIMAEDAEESNSGTVELVNECRHRMHEGKIERGVELDEIRKIVCRHRGERFEPEPSHPCAQRRELSDHVFHIDPLVCATLTMLFGNRFHVRPLALSSLIVAGVIRSLAAVEIACDGIQELSQVISKRGEALRLFRWLESAGRTLLPRLKNLLEMCLDEGRELHNLSQLPDWVTRDNSPLDEVVV